MTFSSWIHLITTVLYAAATVAVAAYYIPRARRESDPTRRLEQAARAMKIYDPFCIAVLGVIIMTGAFSLTAYKEALRERFFEAMGVVLLWKLLATFVLIIFGTYMAFGLGNRLVGRVELGEEPDPKWIDSMLTRIQVVAIVSLVLLAAIVWIATAL